MVEDMAVDMVAGTALDMALGMVVDMEEDMEEDMAVDKIGHMNRRIVQIVEIVRNLVESHRHIVVVLGIVGRMIQSFVQTFYI